MLAALVAICVGASPAVAATTVGSPHLSTQSDGDLFCDSPPCVIVLDKIDGDVVGTPKGVITSWSVRKALGTLQLRVLRNRPGEFVADELHATNINVSDEENGNGDDIVRTFVTHMRVEAGDYIGAVADSGSKLGYLAGSPGDQNFEVNAVDADVTSTNPETTYEPLISARVEPDADNDGYGDESEDDCPSSAATHGACLVVADPEFPRFVAKVSTAATSKVALGSKSATFKGGKAYITLRNANAVRVKGKLKLKLGKKVVGSKAYALAAGATGTIKVKLAKAARKRIARRGKVKLSLGLTAKGATGKTFKTAAKLTVKAPKKAKKKKAKKKKQGGGGGGSSLDGKYVKDSGGPSLRFTVTGGGRKIVNLTGTISGYCSTYVPFEGVRSEYRTLFPGMTSLAVAADGTFAGSQKLSDTTTEITEGKLAGGIATGKVKVTSPGCISGVQSFRSRRSGG